MENKWQVFEDVWPNGTRVVKLKDVNSELGNKPEAIPVGSVGTLLRSFTYSTDELVYCIKWDCFEQPVHGVVLPGRYGILKGGLQ